MSTNIVSNIHNNNMTFTVMVTESGSHMPIVYYSNAFISTTFTFNTSNVTVGDNNIANFTAIFTEYQLDNLSFTGFPTNTSTCEQPIAYDAVNVMEMNVNKDGGTCF